MGNKGNTGRVGESQNTESIKKEKEKEKEKLIYINYYVTNGEDDE